MQVDHNCLLQHPLHAKVEAHKVQITLNVKLGTQTLPEEGHISIRMWFVSNAQTCYVRGNKSKLLRALRQILQFFDTFLAEGSGWRMERVLTLRLKVVRFKTFAGGCRSTKLLPYLARKKACIAIDCENNMCFPYAVLAEMKPKQTNCHGSSAYDLGTLNLEGLSFQCLWNKSDDSRRPILYPRIYFHSLITLWFLHICDESKNQVFQLNLLLYNHRYYLVKSMSRLLRAWFLLLQTPKQIFLSFLSALISLSRKSADAFGGAPARRPEIWNAWR